MKRYYIRTVVNTGTYNLESVYEYSYQQWRELKKYFDTYDIQYEAWCEDNIGDVYVYDDHTIM